MAEQLAVELRDHTGKLNNRRLRRSGQIPAVLYGHGQDNVCLKVSSDALSAALRHGSRLVDLTGAVSESAFIRDIQWNTWGTDVLHVDFTRIRADEVVEVDLEHRIRGEAPGIREGGVVDQIIHDVRNLLPRRFDPGKIAGEHQPSQARRQNRPVGPMQIPEGAKLLVEDMEAIVVQCIVPVGIARRRSSGSGSGRAGDNRRQEGRGRGRERRRVIAYETCGWAGQSGPEVPGHSAQHRLRNIGRVGPKLRALRP